MKSDLPYPSGNQKAPMHLTSDQLEQFARELGEELRAARKARGWTRKQLRDQMVRCCDGEELSLQTIATYELGTRRIAVERVVTMCAALGIPADELVGEALRRVFKNVPGPYETVEVDLAALARTQHPLLLALRQWATVTLGQHDRRAVVVKRLAPSALAALARVAGTTRDDLAQALRSL